MRNKYRRKYKKQRKILFTSIIFIFVLTIGYSVFQSFLNINVIGKIRIDDECVEGNVWEFSQKDEGQEFKVPCSGEYKVELWGA